MTFHGPLLKSGDLDAMKHLARLDIADFEAKQIVDVDEAERLRAVDREGTDDVAERADLFDNLVRPWIRDREERAPEPGEIHRTSVRTVDGVMRARVRHDFRDHVPACGIHNIPMRALERRDVQDLTVR